MKSSQNSIVHIISWGDRAMDLPKVTKWVFLQCCFSHTFRAHLPHSWQYTWEALKEWPPWGQCGRESQLYVAAGAHGVSMSAQWSGVGGSGAGGRTGKIMYSCVEFTEHAQLVHLVNPGFLGRSIARPHNNKDKVVFSALLSASFPKVSNYFLYFGSSSLSQEACFYVISKFCSLHGRSPRDWVPERTGAVDCKENLEGNFRWAQPCPSLPYLDPWGSTKTT